MRTHSPICIWAHFNAKVFALSFTHTLCLFKWSTQRNKIFRKDFFDQRLKEFDVAIAGSKMERDVELYFDAEAFERHVSEIVVHPQKGLTLLTSRHR